MTSFSSMSASTSSMNQKDSQDSGEEEEGVHNDHKAVQLGTELFVCTAKKAGMKEVDHARVSKVVYDMSKGSRFFQNSMKQNQKVNERIEEMKLQLRYLTEARKNHLRQQIDRQIAQLESTRDLTRTKVVVDMDMFYAAVEMRDNPKLKDVPLAVGGMSMISTTNYSARTYGVRAAMPGFIGKELCPDLVFVAPNFQKYTAIAKEIREIFAHYDPDFEAFSLDEAYLDLTSYMEYHWQEYMDKLPIRSYSQQDRSELEEEEEEKEKEQYIEDDFRIVSSQFLYQHREQIAAIIVNEMREKIFSKTQLTASAGIAANTMLAKICSDVNKPNGQFVLSFNRESVLNFLQELSVRKVGGIGKVMEKILRAFEISKVSHLYDHRIELFHLFSEKTAAWLLRISLGVQEEDREASGRKSFSRETTFREMNDSSKLFSICMDICQHLAQDLAKDAQGTKNITLKLKCADFSIRTRSISLSKAISRAKEIYSYANDLLQKELPLTLRLMGVRAANLVSLKDHFEVNSHEKNEHKRQLAINQFTSTKLPNSMETFSFHLCKKKKKTNDGGNSILKFIVQEHSITEETAVSSSSVSSIDNNTFQPCPVCGKLINTSNPITINLHLDACLNSQHKPYQKQKKSKKTKLSITVPQTKHFLSN